MSLYCRCRTSALPTLASANYYPTGTGKSWFICSLKQKQQKGQTLSNRPTVLTKSGSESAWGQGPPNLPSGEATLHNLVFQL